MRISTWACSLSTLLIAAQVAIASAPGSAAADGFEQGAPCHYSGPGAIEAPKVHFTSIAGKPYVPPVHEFTDTENEPASNFAATANWGDGTTSPATVAGEGCYELSVLSHTYLTPGTYSFSYTVHDSHTGLEHTVGSEPFYILSTVPTPILAPSPPVIQAIVGVPWSGVVGEFQINPEVGGLLSANTASIEWGDGLQSPGTITEQHFLAFAVSGSHTYSQPLSAAIKVSVSAGGETGTWTTANALVTGPSSPSSPTAKALVTEPPSPFKFVGQPILAAIPSVKGRSVYEVIFRLNKRLPRTKSGRIQASLNAQGTASSLASFGPHKDHACYAAGSDAFARHSPKSGRGYPFTLTVQQPTSTKTTGQAHLHRYFNFVSMLTAASKRLGC